VPEHFVQNGIGNYGYAGSADLLVPITAPKELAAGQTTPVKAEAFLARLRRYLHPGRRHIIAEPAGRGATLGPRSRRCADLYSGPPAAAGPGAV